MNTPKFRAYCHDKSNMYVVCVIEYDSAGELVITVNDDVMMPHYMKKRTLVNFSLMQYTRLCDKNGVEIYESDVLEIQYEDGSLHGVVKCVDARFITEGVGDTEGYPHEFTSYFAKLCRVRGDIYESPELLEQSK
jgi:uncharacterized phage protein (TIGR01671 family)